GGVFMVEAPDRGPVSSWGSLRVRPCAGSAVHTRAGAAVLATCSRPLRPDRLNLNPPLRLPPAPGGRDNTRTRRVRVAFPHLRPRSMRSEITTPEVLSEESAVELSLRPQRLAEFIGQAKIKYSLRIAVEAALGRREPLDHTLFHGPPGLGKTTLA